MTSSGRAPRSILHAEGFAPTGPILVGFSGGLDSTVLLHKFAGQAAYRELGLRAIHVHHGLHAQADAWVEHCRELCQRLDVDLVVVEVQVAQRSGLGLEAAARVARHAAFARHLRPGETLALAHHQDDQAETVLLRLLRAAGSEGLASMRELRVFAAGWLWRPFLRVPRQQLMEYAQAMRLHWIDDPSNADLGFDRNFLRHRILPVLRERWPQAGIALARSAELLAEDAVLMREEAQKRLEQARGPDSMTLLVSALLVMGRPWRARALREWLAQLQLPALPGKGFAIIESDLLGARRDTNAEYRWAGVVLRRWRDWLHVEPLRPSLALDWQCLWDGRGQLQLPTGDLLWFADAKGKQPAAIANAAGIDAIRSRLGNLAVRARQGGERIVLPGRKHSHALKQCLQEANVPTWLRRRLPLLLAEDGSVLAAGDIVVSARLEQFFSEQSMQLTWQRSPLPGEI